MSQLNSKEIELHQELSKQNGVNIQKIETLINDPKVDLNKKGKLSDYSIESLKPAEIPLKRNNPEIFRLFVNSPRFDPNSDSYLDNAIRYGREEIVDILLGLPNMNVNLPKTITESGSRKTYYPIHLAVTLNKTNILKKLLNRQDIDVNVQDSNGITIAHLVGILGEDLDMVNMVLKDPRVDLNIQDSEGNTPYEVIQISKGLGFGLGFGRKNILARNEKILADILYNKRMARSVAEVGLMSRTNNTESNVSSSSTRLPVLPTDVNKQIYGYLKKGGRKTRRKSTSARYSRFGKTRSSKRAQ